MKNKLSCAIVKDLLPLYVDGLVCEETKETVDAHIDECPACKEIMRNMMPPQEETEANLKDVDYLKKVRKTGRRRAVVATILGVVLTILGISITYYTGSLAQSSDIICQTYVSENTVSIGVKAANHTQRVSRVSFSNSNGMVNVRVYTTPKLFYENKEKEYSYTIDFKVTQVHMGNTVLWEDGMDISEQASLLYRAYNPYVGDMPKNAELANILEISKQFGVYTNELKTDSAPYGWILKLDSTIPASKEGLSLELMRADSCVFLALIGNLDYVIWKYPTENGVETFAFSKEDATDLCGKDIKQFNGSVSDVQVLLNILGI